MVLHMQTEIGQLKEEVRRLEHKVRAISHAITAQAVSEPGRGGENSVRMGDAAGRQELMVPTSGSLALPQGTDPAIRALYGRVEEQSIMIQKLIKDNDHLHFRLRDVQLNAGLFGARLQALEERAGRQGRS